ncbi:rRNA maturation RNase YbeY [Parvularcula lutaonensis]|uniref:Endoribonuclease YbeY n=1 Tax=Parvularcula lutaonensis TaxID=491923 RepID=A0ABV7M977_9PROT|nr:rRNA maturation RNase YbeY [Parvularcula lutaonensis]GGY46041.1 endoribonuclease YbeY [Parvularcula lutaonensis]
MSIDIIIADKAWENLGPEALAERCLEAVRLETADPALARSVSALFTSDEEVQALNAEWRGKDKATNVLSFPAEEIPGLPDEAQPLGDLALASGVCAREATEKGIALGDHAAHLIVHGLLHLLGYDHIGEDEAEVMEDLERRVLARLGIGDPYAETPGHRWS